MAALLCCVVQVLEIPESLASVVCETLKEPEIGCEGTVHNATIRTAVLRMPHSGRPTGAAHVIRCLSCATFCTARA